MSKNDPEQPHEIVIVRRRHSAEHDEAHGGVWKVAFADFMTAMMAFFLVLWIVNSTTKQTRSSLARYFNPIRLSDTTPARKGLNEPREVDFDASSEGALRDSNSRPDNVKPDAVGGRANGSRSAESREPAPEAGSAGARGDRPASGISQSREAFVDPFSQNKAVEHAEADTPERARRGADRRHSAIAMRTAVESMLGEEQAPGLKGFLEVTEAPEGVLISLTDREDTGSFAVGSSAPESKLTRVLTAIAATLKTSQGNIVVRGHTDSRPYKSNGDNWNLSFARAQAAFTGLVRGGLDERRIERVESYADRMPRNPRSPQAPENRRVEILLKQSPIK